MSLQTHTYRKCDVCHGEINNYNKNGTAMLDGMSNNQIWPLGDDEYDVCRGCCVILFNAAELGIAKVDVDVDAFHNAAGWLRDGDMWIKCIRIEPGND